MISIDGRLKIANDILKKLGANFNLESVDKINCNFFIRLYQMLFSSIPDGVIESSCDSSTDLSNMKLLLEELSLKVLHVSLGHIKAEHVIRGDNTALTNVLEIFQGLAQCVKRVNNPSMATDADRKSFKLKCSIRNTQRQADNLVGIAEQAFDGTVHRSVYLQRKIQEILGRREMDSSLRDFVNDNRVPYGAERDSRTSKGRSDLEDDGRSEHEDELTVVTGNDNVRTLSGVSEDSTCGSDNSRNTYVLSARSTADERGPSTDLERHCEIKDAWAQVSKELIHNGYENEFLEMLLQEDESRGRTNGGSTGRVLSRSTTDNRPMSAFDTAMSVQGSMSARRSALPGPRGGLVRPVIKHIGHKTERKEVTMTSPSCDSARSVAASEDGRSDIMTRLLEEFPGLSLSEQTLRQMWSQAARQAASIQRVQQEFVSRLGPGEQRVEDSRRRQQMLFTLLRKEALHQVRLRERVEERESQYSLKASKEKQRQQSAKVKRYYEEFSQRMRARMVQKQAREEQVFRATFQAALKLQRERINDLRRYTKEKKNAKFSQHQRELDSLENYYRDRFSMLAECLRGERQELRLQDKSQEQGLHRRKKEVRTALETEIRQIQDSLVHSQHEAYFRGLDGDNAVASMPLD